MLGSTTGIRRVVAVVALLVIGSVTAACEPAQPGAACNTTDFGDDGAHWVLECKSGRWQWLITKKRLAEIVIAQQAQQRPGGGISPDVVIAGAVGPNDDYPTAWRTAPKDSRTDSFGFPNRQCTSFAAWRLSTHGYSLPVGPGDASQWDTRLAPYGFVNATPAVGAIAQWNAHESSGGLAAGPLGHVAMVQAVFADGSVMVEQYNLGDSGEYVQMRTRAPRYIHVADL